MYYNTCILVKKVLKNMEVEMLYAALSFIFAAFMLHKILSNTRKKPGPNLPPSLPGSLPIVGHLHLFKGLLPQRLQELSRNLGPVFSIRLGMKYVVVISSSSAVEECFTKHDILLANRPPAAVERKSLGFSRTSVIGAPYGDLWRNLRKLCDLEVFAPTRLASFLSIRQDEMNRMISSMYKVSCNGFAKVNLETKIVEMTFNNIMRMIAGKRYYGEEAEDDEEAKQFRKLTKEVVELTGSDNIGEVFPFIRWIGCNGLEKRMTIHSKNTDAFMQALVDEHRNGKRRNTMVDHLLSLQASEPESYSDEVIIGLIVALLIAGTDASVVTTEWTMSLLLNHPEILEKARQELDTHVGHDRMVEEKDLPKLRYLHYIILETLRLFPSVPMLVPHQPSQDIVVGGCTIPKGTFMMVNAWAIHRDPKVWDDPLSFKPERFENRELETHKLLPFGMGRRACPGSGLAQKFVGLALASMIQCFDWERPSAEKIDLTGGSGVVLTKVKTLEAICKPRDAMKNVLQQISSV